jgi:hydroxyacylglutathione hydrolase
MHVTHASAQPVPRVRRIDFINQLTGRKSTDRGPRRAVAAVQNPKMLLPTATDGLAVHQLLCGREIADPSGGNPVFGMASQMANFVYLVIDTATQDAAVVDAAWDCEGVVRVAQELGVRRITHALYTHKHFDHGGGRVPPRMTGGRQVVLEGAHSMAALAGAEVCACGPDVAELREQCGLAEATTIEEGSKLAIGGHACTVLHTPGHTPGSVCFQVGDLIFTGDTLFIGACGRVDLPGSVSARWHSSYPGNRYATRSHNISAVIVPDLVVTLPGDDPRRILPRCTRACAGWRAWRTSSLFALGTTTDQFLQGRWGTRRRRT